MYCHSFFVISVRGIGLVPTTAPSAASGCIGFMNAGFGARLAPERLAVRRVLRAPARFFAPPRFAGFFASRLAFFAAILSTCRSNGDGYPYESRLFSLRARPALEAKSMSAVGERNRETRHFPYVIRVFSL